MRKGGDSGKAYHVKKQKSLKKKRKKELKKQIREATKQGRDTMHLRVLLALED